MPKEVQLIHHSLRSFAMLQWYAVPLFVLVIYLYINELERKNFSAFFLGIAFWSWAMTWEIYNSLLFHFTDRAPLWTALGGDSSFIIYIGMNIEVCFFVALMGPLVIKSLPEDRKKKILFIPNRLFITGLLGLLAVSTEYILHEGGLIYWHWSFWGRAHLWPIWLGYSSTWYILTAAHDYCSLKCKKVLAGVMTLSFLILHLVFSLWLHWV
jgi:hypothetical protein